MIVYHTSNVLIAHPDVMHSREALDFGKGFYVTKLKEQAIKYADRFFRGGVSSFLHEFDYNFSSRFKLKSFDAYDAEWLDFISDCRKGSIRYKEFDIIEGGVANDRVFQTVDLYMAGIYNKEQALQRLIYEKPNHQICFVTQDAIDHCLHLVKHMVLTNG